MGKDLPYFKFYVSEWNSGNVTLEDFQTQGVFINVCSHYWARNGNLTLSEIKRRLSKAKPTAFASLIQKGLISVKKDIISIGFLDEQLVERKVLSETNAMNGSLGGRPKSERKPTAFAPESNIEEKREEESKGEERIREIGEGDFCISVKAKYLNDVPLRIFNLETYFQETQQLEQIEKAGWGAKFSGFLKANPGAVYDDAGHLYNAFRKFAGDSNGQVNGQSLGERKAQERKAKGL